MLRIASAAHLNVAVVDVFRASEYLYLYLYLSRVTFLEVSQVTGRSP